MKLESPKTNFSVRVMNKIFEENSLLEKIKSERILGKGFWIILVLFIVLFAAIIIISNTGLSSESVLAQILPKVDTSSVSGSYQSLLAKSGAAPISIASILLASSILLFIERFINANSKIFSV